MIERISDDIFEFLLFTSTLIIRLTYLIIKILVALIYVVIHIICLIIYNLLIFLIKSIKNNYMELILIISISLILYNKFNKNKDLKLIMNKINEIEQRQQKAKLDEQQLIKQENDLIQQHIARRIANSINENMLIDQECQYIEKLINNYKLSNIIDTFFECPICKDEKLDIEMKTLKCHSTHQFCKTCLMRIDKCPLCNSLIN
jgi:hypothetical protein